MKNLFTLLIFAFLFSNFCLAQQQIEFPKKNKVASLTPSFWMGFPTGEFKDAMDVTAYGVGVYSLGKISKTPVWAGASFGYLMLDREKRNIRQEVDNTGLSEKYRWRTAVQSIYLNGIIRYQPELDLPNSPYLELNAGARRLYTRTTLRENNSGENDNGGGDLVDAKLEIADWGFTYGGTFGFYVYLMKNRDIALDVRCSYLRTGAANFYARKTINESINAPIDAFELTSSSATDMLIPQIGFVVNFPVEDCDDDDDDD